MALGGMVEILLSSTRLHQAMPAFPHSPHFLTPTFKNHPANTSASCKGPFKALQMLFVYAA